jgi:hypothetical protein
MNCNINEGMILRLGVTYYILRENSKRTNDTTNLLLLPLLLTGLDLLDNLLMPDKSCTKTYDYQIKDKIVDVLSYLILLFFYESDDYLKFFVFYRLIGVILYTLTKNSDWLIIFVDMVKEYMIYKYIFGKNDSYLPILIFGKVLFEIYFHKMKNGKIKE